jgi:hypothetical protein
MERSPRASGPIPPIGDAKGDDGQNGRGRARLNHRWLVFQSISPSPASLFARSRTGITLSTATGLPMIAIDGFYRCIESIDWINWVHSVTMSR